MRRLVIVILALFLLSCAPKVEVVCKAPYIEWKAGECCLDTNNNGVCDWDEQKVVEKIAEEQKVEIDIMQELLAQAPDNYWFHSYDAGQVVVVGDKRHSYVDVEEGITDIFWDTTAKKAEELCDIKEEIIQEGDKFQPDRPICNPD